MRSTGRMVERGPSHVHVASRQVQDRVELPARRKDSHEDRRTPCRVVHRVSRCLGRLRLARRRSCRHQDPALPLCARTSSTACEHRWIAPPSWRRAPRSSRSTTRAVRHRVALGRAQAAQPALPRDALRRSRASARPPSRRAGLQARAAAFPAADSNYHTYQEVSDDDGRDRRGRTRRSSAAVAIGTSYGGRDDLGAEDLRQRRRRRGRAGGAVHGQPARARAPDRRDGDLPAQRADGEVRDRRADRERSSTRARSGSSRQVNPDGAEFDVATGSYAMWRKNRQPNDGLVGGRHRPQPQLGLPVGLLRRLERDVLVGDLPRRVAVLGARDAGRAQLRPVAAHRRHAADQDRHRLPHVLRADPVALRLHDRRHGRRRCPRRAQHVRDARPEHGGHEQLHARAGVGPVHRRRRDRRLAVGQPGDLRLHVRDVPDDARTRASIRPTR